VETGEALRDSGVPVVEFRASIVIGAGSLSFEMIRALIERLPAMICRIFSTRWVKSRTRWWPTRCVACRARAFWSGLSIAARLRWLRSGDGVSTHGPSGLA
jgi:hypothetical protein